ncbi:MAG TPA: polynucleotide adenylyltransferase PcnB [Rhabdochlamydiaceae bacterium]|jgi:poly(A) polymerase|nr:polynucleotide adenylyltransferase PcnB [Rhabdochlamydiaceae bacterium]
MNPKVYLLDDHQIPLAAVDADALRVVKNLQKAGHVAYIVGGGVRDLLLQQRPKDYDISTSAKPEEIKDLFRSQCLLIGRRFRLAHIRCGRKILEVSTFRSGDPESDQLIVRDNEWGSPEQDVLRRDFTINGLFYDPSNQTVIDYVGGYLDLQKKYLRTIGQPFLRFKQDPVRMIRLIKFQARFGFDVDPDARLALAECRLEIMKSSQARIFEELLRMLESGAAASFMRLMNETGFLEHLMPAFSNFLETPEGGDVFSYLQEVDTRTKKIDVDRGLLLSCLVFPFLQKALQTRFIDRGKVPHLGEIQNETHDVISTLFHPFFLIPRKLRMKIISILTAQFRMTPYEKRAGKRPRIPRDPDFPLALEFLDLRTCLEPALKGIWETWQDVYLHPRKKHPHRKHHA